MKRSAPVGIIINATVFHLLRTTEKVLAHLNSYGVCKYVKNNNKQFEHRILHF